MADTEKKKSSAEGAFILGFLMLLGVATAYLWQDIKWPEPPKPLQGKLLFEGQVMVSVPTPETIPLSEGMPASVTVDGYGKRKFVGAVKLVHRATGEDTMAIIQLAVPPTDLEPPVACQVTLEPIKND